MAYVFQTFVTSQVLTSTQMNQVESNIKDHVHGAAGVTDTFNSINLSGQAILRGVVTIACTGDSTYSVNPLTVGPTASAYGARIFVNNPGSGGPAMIAFRCESGYNPYYTAESDTVGAYLLLKAYGSEKKFTIKNNGGGPVEIQDYIRITTVSNQIGGIPIFHSDGKYNITNIFSNELLRKSGSIIAHNYFTRIGSLDFRMKKQIDPVRSGYTQQSFYVTSLSLVNTINASIIGNFKLYVPIVANSFSAGGIDHNYRDGVRQQEQFSISYRFMFTANAASYPIFKFKMASGLSRIYCLDDVTSYLSKPSYNDVSSGSDIGVMFMGYVTSGMSIPISGKLDFMVTSACYEGASSIIEIDMLCDARSSQLTIIDSGFCAGLY